VTVFRFAILLSAFLPSLLWGSDVSVGPAADSKNDAPIYLTADRIESLQDDKVYRAEGSVVLTQGAMELTAERLQLEAVSGKVIAEGAVHLNDGANRAEAERIELELQTGLGILTHARLFLPKENYLLEAERMARVDEERYELDAASFTPCGCDPDWRIRARRLRVRLEGYLTLRDLTFYAGDWPVFYLPYFVYPAGTERKSGLLVPRVGFSSRDGFRYRQEFFWAISPHRDATLSVDSRGRRGIGGGLEYRYRLAPEAGGEIQSDFFRDKKESLGRWDLKWKHTHRVSQRVSGGWDLRYLNEKNTLRALSDEADERAARTSVSHAGLTYRGDAGLAYLSAQYTQTLSAPNDDTTLQRLPEIGGRYAGWSGPVQWQLEGTAVNFWRKSGFKTPRADLGARLSWPLGRVTPWVGVRETAYRRTLGGDRSELRTIFPMGIDAEASFRREWPTMRHLLRPRLHYRYIDLHEVPNLPQFDEIDALTDRNAVTLALDQQLFGTDKDGQFMEWLFFRLSQSHQIDRQRDHAPHVSSPIRAELRLAPASQVGIDTDLVHDIRDDRILSGTTQIRLTHPLVSLRVGRRYLRGEPVPKTGDLYDSLSLGDEVAGQRTDFWTGRIDWVTGPIQWRGTGDFDADRDKPVQSSLSMLWQRECWGITLTYADLPDRHEVSFLVQLKGLDPIGKSSRP
jgi:LPS-assembly protein